MATTQSNTYAKDYLDRMTALEFELAAAYEIELVEDDTVEDDTVYEEDMACELVKDYISDWINGIH